MSRLDNKLRAAANVGTRAVSKRFGDRLGMHPVIEYPKSGGTWLAYMLSESLKIPFAKLPRLPIAMESVVHGHWSYQPSLKNVTFLTRDGRDVAVSFYFHYVRQYNDGVLTGRRLALIRSLYGGRPQLDDHAANLPRFLEHMFKRAMGVRQNWADFCEGWHGKPGVVYTRYEDLHADAVREIERIAKAHGRNPPAWRVRQAVDANSMERTTGRKPGQEDVNSFIRKGVVGDWVNFFNDESRQIFADRAGQTLLLLGYERDPDWRTWSAGSRSGGAESSGALRR